MNLLKLFIWFVADKRLQTFDLFELVLWLEDMKMLYVRTTGEEPQNLVLSNFQTRICLLHSIRRLSEENAVKPIGCLPRVLRD